MKTQKCALAVFPPIDLLVCFASSIFFIKISNVFLTDGSEDDKIAPEGLVGYKVMPPLGHSGPDQAQIEEPNETLQPEEALQEGDTNSEYPGMFTFIKIAQH